MTETSPAPLIEDLFHNGHPLEHVIGVGLDVGWTRDDIMGVLRENGWTLDGSGRLPRSKRNSAPRSLRHPGAGGTPDPHRTGGVPRAGTTSSVASPAGAERKARESNPVGPEPKAVFGTAAVAVRPPSSPPTVPEPLSAPLPSPEPVPAPEPPAPPPEPAAPTGRPPLAARGCRPDGRDLDDWLDQASRSTSAAVQECADRCALLAEQLHDALDDLVRAEYSHAREAP